MKLHLDLLGTPIATLDGTTIELPPKSLALLAYLLIEGRSKRDQLAKILWPNVSANPRNNLSQERASLIKHLGFDALQGDPETLEVLKAVSCDATVFRATQQNNLGTAWRIYRGEFLKDLEFHPRLLGGRAFGEDFEFWLMQQRSGFNEQHRRMSIALALEEVQRGSFEGAIPLLEVTQTSDLIAEDAARLLMLCLGALGQADRATSVFAKISGQLQSELGVEPMRLTREVFALVRSEPEGCVQRLRSLAPTLSPPPRKPDREERVVKFVGREGELKQVLETLLDNTSGHLDRADNDNRRPHIGVRCVLLFGEPGVGKTRLIEETISALSQRAVSTDWLRVNTRATPDQLPLMMVQRAARSVITEHPNTAERLGQITREALARFLPDLLESNTTVIPPDLEQRALFTALRTVFSTPEAATLLVLEDLHWADDGSIAYIEYLLGDAPDAGLIVLATARDSERSRSSLDRLTSLVRNQDGGLVLRLDGLSSGAVQEMALSLGQIDVNASDLHRRSGGNPLFVLELLQGQDAGRKRLAELVQDRVRACGDLAVQVLEALAVVGDGTSIGVLRDVSGRGLEETIGSIEVLEAAKLITQVASEVFFRHDLIRELIHATMPSSRRALLELRAARSLQTQPILAAQHYLACQRLWDRETTSNAAQVFLEAGRESASRGDAKMGLEWLDWAWKTVETVGWRFDVTLVRARLLERYGLFREASETLDRTVVFLAAASVAQRASWHSLKSKIELSVHGNNEQAHLHAELALAECGDSNDPDLLLERCRALRNLGWAMRVNRAFPQAVVQLRASLAIAEVLDETDERSASLQSLGFCLIELRDPSALAVLNEALSLNQQTSNEKEIETLNCLGMYYERIETDYALAKRYFQQAYQNALTWGVPYSYTYLNNLAAIHFYLGEYVQARDVYRSALLEYRNSGAENEAKLAYIFGNLAEVGVRLGDQSATLEHLSHARAILERKPNGTLRADLDFVEGELWMLENRHKQALQAFERCATLANECHHPTREAWALARVAVLENAVATAQRASQRWDAPVTRAALFELQGNGREALEVLRNDPFETGVLYLARHRRLGLADDFNAAKTMLGAALRGN